MPLAYKCRGCGNIEPKRWDFRCPNPACGGFYNIIQTNADIPGAEIAEPIDGEVISLQDAIAHVIEIPRIETSIAGVDHVLGGGFAKNGMYLLCGDPGIGKTTVLIQVFQALARLRHEVIFITGEQTVNDVALRAKSFGKFSARLSAVRETDLDRILDIVAERKPAVIAIDSIQTLSVASDDGYSLDIGGATSIKTAARVLTQFAKDQSVCIVIIGHVTKDGSLSGPNSLSHYVDCCLYFNGNIKSPVRYLRCDSKNRFGPTPRYARFNMTDKGLVEYPEDDDPMAIQTAKPLPLIESVPLDLESSFPNPNLESFWTSPDGTPATKILAVKCDVDGCRGTKDRACTSANGTRESGFHDARIAKAKVQEHKDDVVYQESNTDIQQDPFLDEIAKPLTSKPRIKKNSA